MYNFYFLFEEYLYTIKHVTFKFHILFNNTYDKSYTKKYISKYLYDLGYKSKSGRRLDTTIITRIIENPKYKGYYCGNKTTKIELLSEKVKYKSQDEWVMYKDETGNKVPAIVSEEIWDKSQEIYKSHSDKMKKEGTSYNNKYKYSGKIFCVNALSDNLRSERSTNFIFTAIFCRPRSPIFVVVFVTSGNSDKTSSICFDIANDFSYVAPIGARAVMFISLLSVAG